METRKIKLINSNGTTLGVLWILSGSGFALFDLLGDVVIVSHDEDGVVVLFPGSGVRNRELENVLNETGFVDALREGDVVGIVGFDDFYETVIEWKLGLTGLVVPKNEFVECLRKRCTELEVGAGDVILDLTFVKTK